MSLKLRINIEDILTIGQNISSKSSVPCFGPKPFTTNLWLYLGSELLSSVLSYPLANSPIQQCCSQPIDATNYMYLSHLINHTYPLTLECSYPQQVASQSLLNEQQTIVLCVWLQLNQYADRNLKITQYSWGVVASMTLRQESTLKSEPSRCVNDVVHACLQAGCSGNKIPLQAKSIDL